MLYTGKIHMKNLAVISCSALLLAACGQSSEVMSGKFSSMDKCLSAVKRNTNASLNIITDKPGEISGKLSNGEHFSCQTKATGTDGLHVEGWYTIKK